MADNIIRNKYTVIALISLLLVIVFHFITLTISPLVWGDEVIYNNVTIDFLNSGNFFCPIDPSVYNYEELLYYGPIYYILNALVMKIAGIGIFQQRFLGVLFGMFIFLFFALYSRTEIKGKLWFLILLAFLFDPFFNAGINRGRLDNIANFFYFTSIWLVIPDNSGRTKDRFLNIFFSGIFCALAILTTSRFVLFTPVFLIIFIFQLVKSTDKRKVFFSWVAWTAAVVSIFSVWVFLKFGSYNNFIEYYLRLMNDYADFMGTNFTVPTEVIPMLLLTILVSLFAIIQSKILFRDYGYLVLLAIVATFYIAVGDVGPYSVLVIPYLYLVMGKALSAMSELKTKTFTVSRFLLLGLIVLNISIFLFKGSVLYLDREARNYQPVEEFIKENIPSGAKVTGSDVYYYAALKNHNPFTLYNSFDPDFTRLEKDRRERFNYDYLVVAESMSEYDNYLFKLLEEKDHLEKTAEYKSRHLDLLEWLRVNNIFKGLGTFGNYNFSSTGYDGIIYKRIRSDDSAKIEIQHINLPANQ